jgi:hypothetical protein
MLNVKADVILIIDATGSLSHLFQKHLAYIHGDHSCMELWMAAVIGTVHILGRSLLISKVFSRSCHVSHSDKI